jgi:FAD/FMN-containing dehydrogenase
LRQSLGDRLTGFELMSAHAMSLSRKHQPELPDPLPGYPWYALVQADDTTTDSPLEAQVERALNSALEADIALDATLAQSGEQASALWALRENIAEAQRREGPNIKHDISVPVSAIPRFLDEAAVALTAAFPDVRFVTFGHLGDGNLHYNLAAPAGQEAAAFMANTASANRIVHDLVAARRSISADTGSAEARRARSLQERGGARPDAQGQDRARSGGHPESRQDPVAARGDENPALDRCRICGAARIAPVQRGQGEASGRCGERAARAGAGGGYDGPLCPLWCVSPARGRKAEPGRNDLR